MDSIWIILGKVKTSTSAQSYLDCVCADTHDPDCAQAMVGILHEATQYSGQGPSGHGHHNCSQMVIASTSEDGLCVEDIMMVVIARQCACYWADSRYLAETQTISDIGS